MTLDLPTDRMMARVEGAVGWMVFDNPDRRNAVSQEMWAAIPAILDHFEADPDVRVVVLRGAGGRAFVSGADISQFEEKRASAEAVALYDAISDVASKRLETCPKPTIAMIDGWCIGGGVGIAVSCDLRIASDTARFGVPAARLGLGYGMDGVAKLMALVGPSNTKEIFYTARHFTAAEALGMGLVNRVLPAAELEAYVATYCETIAANAPMTLRALKVTVEELNRGSAHVDRARAAALVRACFKSEDYIEGRRAFMEKRSPALKGR